MQNNQTNFLLYKTANSEVKVAVLLQDETIWLTQKMIGELFGKGRSTITEHLQNIFKSDELDEKSVCRDFRHTASDGKNYTTKYYNLDAIISVGYRVNSASATQFRIWATNTLKEYIIKGFVMDDERLKNPQNQFGKDYFDEQLERIRDIRSSERRLYQKITDIYSQCSADYDKTSNFTQEFFATVQNKLHWAIVGETSAEIVYHRVDSEKTNLGLTSWKNAPEGRVRKSDVTIAKNYLSEDELQFFNRIVTMYLDYAEMQAKNGKLMYMNDWITKLDAFLVFNARDVLEHKGTISREVTNALAYEEYEKYRVLVDKNYISDFDRDVKRITGGSDE